MPKMHISKSVDINAPIEKVYEVLSDLHQWRSWSPWLITQPDAKVNVADDGKYYDWDGHRVGAGNMTITKESQPQSIEYDLVFLKPWKSKAKVRFDCVSKGDTTSATWSMDSSLPFYMFWMKKMMVAFVGADYQRGLTMLKEYVEEGKVSSQLDFKGSSAHPGGQYIGVKSDVTMDVMGPQMATDFQSIQEYVEEHEVEVSGKPFCIYHKWDMVNAKVSYTAATPVKVIPSHVPTGMISGSMPATKVYTLSHRGPYKYLGNAWSALYTMHRNKEFKMVKSIHPFETYINQPGEVAEEELVTEISFPMK